MSVGIDIGEEDNIHPKNKQEVGRRLALVALSKTYGRPGEDLGPEYESIAPEGGAIRVKFSHLGGGLVAKGGGPLHYFTIAGADHKFVFADAKIDGETVLVSSPEVPKPVAVRYAWASNPEGANLYNKAGLPAAPFRSDGPITPRK
jgi:sialate O-acetylesterase